MKKIFTLLTLALLSIASMNAEEATFDFQNNNGQWPVGEGMNFADGNLTSPLTMGEVTLTNVQGDASQPARIMRANDGISALYVYKNGSIQFNAAEGRALTKIEVTMKSNAFDLTPSNGSVEADVWTGNATEVLFTAASNRQMLKLVVTTADENGETVKPDSQEETFDVEVSTIADFNQVEDGKVVKLALADARVNGYFYLTQAYYVEDATGATVFKGLELTPGTKLNGYIIGTKNTNKNIDFMSNPANPVEHQLVAGGTADTFTAEEVALTGTPVSISGVESMANYGRLLTLANVTISGTSQNKTLTDAEGNTITARDYMGVLPADYVWPATAERITGILIYYMTRWFFMPISADAIQETAAGAPALFDFTTGLLRGYAGKALTDAEGYIYNETYTQQGVSLQVTSGSAPSRLTYATNRDTCLVLYKEYATMLFTAPQGKAIQKIEFTYAGSVSLNFTASPEGLDGLVWQGNATAVRFVNEGTAYLKSALVTLTDATGETVELTPLAYEEVSTIAAFNALQPGTYAKVTLTDAEVIGRSADGYSTLWIQDATGGCWIQYTSLNARLQEGTRFSGTLYVARRTASGASQMKETPDTPQSEFTATELDEYTTLSGTISELNVAENLGRVVTISDATLTIGKTTANAQNGTLTQGDATIDVNNGGETANQLLHKLDFTEYTEGQQLQGVTIVAILSPASASKNQLLPLSITSEVVDGISTPGAASTNPTAIYNLQGQRMQQLAKGINIVGGKKIVVK